MKSGKPEKALETIGESQLSLNDRLEIIRTAPVGATENLSTSQFTARLEQFIAFLGSEDNIETAKVIGDLLDIRNYLVKFSATESLKIVDSALTAMSGRMLVPTQELHEILTNLNIASVVEFEGSTG